MGRDQRSHYRSTRRSSRREGDQHHDPVYLLSADLYQRNPSDRGRTLSVMAKKKVTPILDGKFEVVGVKPGKIGTPIGTVDLSRIDEDSAERLVKMKSSYIRKAEGKKDKEEPAKGKQYLFEVLISPIKCLPSSRLLFCFEGKINPNPINNEKNPSTPNADPDGDGKCRNKSNRDADHAGEGRPRAEYRSDRTCKAAW